MPTKPLFSIPQSADMETVDIVFEGECVSVPTGINLAAALLVAGVHDFRSSAIGHVPRAPYCMMGICFECLVEIDGIPARQSCLIQVREGMEVRRQIGALELGDHHE
jgi:predicted molibdopterin-dependent oxidoreductase YjgC